MALEYSITAEPSLIAVSVDGLPDYLSIDRLWHDIVAACKRHDCFDILGVSTVQPASLSEAYDHAAIFEAVGVTKEFHIAWVEENPEAKEWIRLSEAVVRNRQLAKTKVFNNVADAKRWLTEKSSERP